MWRTRHKFGGGVPLLPQPFHLSLSRPVGRHCRAVFAPAAASADRASGTHLVCSLRNRQHNSDSWIPNPRLDGSGKGSAIRDSSAGRRTQTTKIRRRLREITSLVAPYRVSFRAHHYALGNVGSAASLQCKILPAEREQGINERRRLPADCP